MNNKPLTGSYLGFLKEELGRAIALNQHAIDYERLTRAKINKHDWFRMFDYQLDHLHPAEKDALVRVAKLLAELAFEIQAHDSRKTNLHQLLLNLDDCRDNEY